MQKYDKLLVPSSIDDGRMDISKAYVCRYSTSDARSGWKPECQLEEQQSVIVLTVEELEKVWNAGWRAKVLENHPTAINKDFKTYLQSKGINIEC